MTDPTQDVRRVLVIAHTGREDARDVAGQFCRSLHAHGIALRLLEQEADELALDLPDVEIVKASAEAGVGCELALVIGGDGTILRAAELSHECGTPLLGVNLGHVGFLAEAESDDVEIVIDAIVHRRYSAEERLTLDVSVFEDTPAGQERSSSRSTGDRCPAGGATGWCARPPPGPPPTTSVPAGRSSGPRSRRC